MPQALAIELTDVEAKLVQLSVSKKAAVVLEKAARVSFPEGEKTEETIAERAQLIRAALKSGGFHTSAPACLVVPKQSATVRRVRLPSNDPNEIASMAAFEAEKIIPFNVERHIISTAMIGDRELEGSDVLITAVDKPVMEQWLAHCAGTNVEFITADVSTLGLVHALVQVPGAPMEGCVGIVHIGEIHTEITLLLDGEIATTRSVMHGLRTLTKALKRDFRLERDLVLSELRRLSVLEPDDWVPDGVAPKPERNPEETREAIDLTNTESSGAVRVEEATALRTQAAGKHVRDWTQKLVVNIQRTYEFGAREYALPSMTRIYLAGEGLLLGSLDEALQLNLGVEVQPLDLASSAKLAPKAVVDKELLPIFAPAYGAALRVAREEHEFHINLLPPEMIARQIRSERRLQWVITSCIAAVALAIGFYWYATRASLLAEQRDLYQSHIAELGEIISGLEDMSNRMEIIQRIRSERAGALDILEAISEYEKIGPVTQQGRLVLLSVDFQLGTEVMISGKALSIEDVNDFIRYLAALRKNDQPIFRSVDQQSVDPTTLPRRDQTIYRFQILARMATEGSTAR
jgi:Tfp pilus assembly PilM family ATPase/Tfp pilus assembly protein PilN